MSLENFTLIAIVCLLIVVLIYFYAYPSSERLLTNNLMGPAGQALLTFDVNADPVDSTAYFMEQSKPAGKERLVGLSPMFNNAATNKLYQYQLTSDPIDSMKTLDPSQAVSYMPPLSPESNQLITYQLTSDPVDTMQTLEPGRQVNYAPLAQNTTNQTTERLENKYESPALISLLYGVGNP